MKPSLLLRLLVIWSIAMIVHARAAAGTSAWYEGFEGPQPSWRPFDGNVRYSIDQQQRVQGQAHTGNRCELLRITGSAGSELLFSHDVGQPYVIDELMPTVWVRSDRPGMQLLARVVLPRTIDPQTGQPITALLRGSSYTTPGRWQQLRIDDLTKQLTHYTWSLRTQLGPQADPREAYVEAVLLNVYGGPGTTNVWIDDLDIAGYVSRVPQAPAPAAGADRTLTAPAVPAPPYGRLPGTKPADAARQRRKVELTGRVLMVDGRPVFPRAIQYQGEPLKLLAQLGFNVVWLSRLPTAEMMEQASQLGLWLVAPPPRPVEEDRSAIQAPPLKLGPAYDCVLAWDLGRGLTGQPEQVLAIQRWAEQVRAADDQPQRPFICQPTGGLKPYSNIARLLLIGRGPLGSSLELKDYGTWVRQRPWLAVQGTPTWTAIQTQPPPSLRQQWRAMGVEEPLPSRFAPEQIRLLVYTSVTAGSRGLLFDSYTSLAEADPDTRVRAMTLELLNLELDLVEPWLAAGNFITTIPSTEPGLVGALLQAERARILVPLWTEPGSQFVSGQAAGKNTSFLVPAVPEGNVAYDVLPGGFRPLYGKRQGGGTLVTLDEFSLTSLVLFTQDALVLNDIAQRATRIGQRAAQLQRELAVAKLQSVQQTEDRLPQRDSTGGHAGQWLADSRKDLQSCDGLIASKSYRDAYAYADRAMRQLRLLERARWESAVAALGSPVASPTSVCFATLPAHRQFLDRLSTAVLGENRLMGGDFEDLAQMHQAGWHHFQHSVEGVSSEVNLDPVCALRGQYGLRLAARPLDPKNPPVMVESPPNWITSPGIPVQAGEILCIQGWVHIPAPIIGSVDGLLIVESLGGEALAERIGETAGWKQFTLYRTAPESGRMSVSFALSGLGEAWLDDVRICPVVPAGSSAGPPALPPSTKPGPPPTGGSLPIDRTRIGPVKPPVKPHEPGR